MSRLMDTYPFCPLKISVLRIYNLIGSKICVLCLTFLTSVNSLFCIEYLQCAKYLVCTKKNYLKYNPVSRYPSFSHEKLDAQRTQIIYIIYVVKTFDHSCQFEFIIFYLDLWRKTWYICTYIHYICIMHIVSHELT